MKFYDARLAVFLPDRKCREDLERVLPIDVLDQMCVSWHYADATRDQSFPLEEAESLLFLHLHPVRDLNEVRYSSITQSFVRFVVQGTSDRASIVQVDSEPFVEAFKLAARRPAPWNRTPMGAVCTNLETQTDDVYDGVSWTPV